ncbi:MAG: invasion associated locus B family protein [Rhodobacteraceae bacterium]|nr:invasion associated locus B family protein [Paracoccaceae bacterium]
MLRLTTAFTLAAALALATAAGADTTTPAPAAPAADATAPSTGAPAADTSGIGSAYVQSTSGDWEVRCVHAQDGHDPCQAYQLLKDEQGNSVAEFSAVGLPAGQPAAAGATIVTPLETLLTQQVTLQIDALPAKVYPFLFCNTAGCVARVGFTADELAAMKKGQKIALTIIPVAAPDQKVELTVSLKGFTAGYDTATKLNAAATAAAPAAPAPAPAAGN